MNQWVEGPKREGEGARFCSPGWQGHHGERGKSQGLNPPDPPPPTRMSSEPYSLEKITHYAHKSNRALTHSLLVEDTRGVILLSTSWNILHDQPIGGAAAFLRQAGRTSTTCCRC